MKINTYIYFVAEIIHPPGELQASDEISGQEKASAGGSD
jgi:hypothetical protein